jgi:hypothetical protein
MSNRIQFVASGAIVLAAPMVLVEMLAKPAKSFCVVRVLLA